jgi:hypothetical protein
MKFFRTSKPSLGSHIIVSWYYECSLDNRSRYSPNAKLGENASTPERGLEKLMRQPHTQFAFMHSLFCKDLV